MKSKILKYLDKMLYQLNEGTDDNILDDNKLKEYLNSIFNFLYSINEEYNSYEAETKSKNKLANIKNFVYNLTKNYSLDNSSDISLDVDDKEYFNKIIKKFLCNVNDIWSIDVKSNPNSSNKWIDDYKKYNILSKNNNLLTDEFIEKLKSIKLNNIKSIKDAEAAKNLIKKI